MKIKHLFGLAVIAAMTASCSSNNDLVNGGNGSSKNETGTAYASFKINLPTTSGTRADVDPDGTPDFNEGTAAEYEVKNGTILIFDATTEQFVTSANLGTMNPWTDVKTDGVTTSAIATVQLSGVTVGGEYKALVLLNNDVDATTEDATTEKVKLPTTSETYATWNADPSKANPKKYVSTDGIFMANAPMYTSERTEPTTLVKINHVCASPEEAQAKAATVVYVERGLAKVTMKDFSTEGYKVADGTYKDAKVEIKNWQLDVTNNSTFPVHQTSGLMTAWDQIWNTPRFYDKTSTAFQRVYWGVDPNYNEAKYQTLANCKTAFKMITKDDVNGVTANPQYCLENTFDLNNMKQGQTTRVVFKAVFTPGGFTAPATFYKIGNNTAIWKEADLKQQIKTVALTAMGITDPVEQKKYDVDLTKGTNISGKAGQHLIKADNITYTDEAASSEVKENVVKKINEKLNTINEKLGLSDAAGISTYLNGEAYYIARIKHFNELTSWTPGTAYGSKNKEFLGRYGVLRNNWYELSVNSVSGLGYPDVPEVKPTLPDDENDQYISVSVKILSWAKRSQKIDL